MSPLAETRFAHPRTPWADAEHLMLILISSGVMPRTTVDLDASVLNELRRRAQRERKSMGSLASELLAQQLSVDQAGAIVQPLRWICRDLGIPRVDLEDKESLNALLDERS